MKVDFCKLRTDLSQSALDEQELYLSRECGRKGWMERYYMNLNSSVLHLSCTIEMMTHSSWYSMGQSGPKSPDS